jgi:hypothetical protein
LHRIPHIRCSNLCLWQFPTVRLLFLDRIP